MNNAPRYETFVALSVHRKGRQRQCVDPRKRFYNFSLLKNIALAMYWQQLLESGQMESLSAIARAEQLHHSMVARIVRLSTLSPEMIERCLRGEQLRALSARGMTRDPIPVLWSAQHPWSHTFKK